MNDNARIVENFDQKLLNRDQNPEKICQKAKIAQLNWDYY